MKFLNLDILPTEDQLASVETKLGIKFPPPLRKHYLAHNGGEPESHVFHGEGVKTTLNETLPIISGKNLGDAVEVYSTLIKIMKLAPKHFFPIAPDSRGDHFLVDCNTQEGSVFFLASNRGNPTLKDLHLTLNEFWDCLMTEEEG